MKSYRITKYNPAKRNIAGAYLDQNEWTSICDVEFSEYIKVENAYIKSLHLLLSNRNITSLSVDKIENHLSLKGYGQFKKEGRFNEIEIDFHKELESLKNGQVLKWKNIDKISRLILREVIWMNLVSEQFAIEFGYDYYMYVKCNKITNQEKREIESSGLYVEAFSRSQIDIL